jgi:hypothetical protein
MDGVGWELEGVKLGSLGSFRDGWCWAGPLVLVPVFGSRFVGRGRLIKGEMYSSSNRSRSRSRVGVGVGGSFLIFDALSRIPQQSSPSTPFLCGVSLEVVAESQERDGEGE